MMEEAKVIFCRIEGRDNEDLPLPSYESEHAAGMDICADLDRPMTLAPGERMLIGTGLRVAIDPGCEIQVRPRSGLAAKYGVTILNTPGTIDADYRGEIRIILINLGSGPYTVHRGDRVAQLVPAPVLRASIQLADSLDTTARGSGGFGHTGV